MTFYPFCHIIQPLTSLRMKHPNKKVQTRMYVIYDDEKISWFFVFLYTTVPATSLVLSREYLNNVAVRSRYWAAWPISMNTNTKYLRLLAFPIFSSVIFTSRYFILVVWLLWRTYSALTILDLIISKRMAISSRDILVKFLKNVSFNSDISS